MVGDTLSITFDLTFYTASSGWNRLVNSQVLLLTRITLDWLDDCLSKLDIIYMKLQLEISQN